MNDADNLGMGPQTYELGRLMNFQSFDKLKEFSVDRGSKGLRRMMSVYYQCSNYVLVLLPGMFV